MTADLDARTTNLGTGTGSFAKAFVAALPAGRTLAASYAGTMIALTESTDTKPRQQHPGNVLRRSTDRVLTPDYLLGYLGTTLVANARLNWAMLHNSQNVENHIYTSIFPTYSD